jgi:hypothetical protein
MKSLLEQLQQRLKARPAQLDEKAQQILNQIRQALVQKQAKQLSTLNAKAQSRVKAMERLGGQMERVGQKPLSAAHDRPIRIVPKIVPKITTMEPTEVRPKTPVYIVGSGFMERGHVYLELEGEMIRCEIKRWSDTYVEAKINPNISGKLRMNGEVIIENDLGKQASKPVTFIPEEEIRTISRGASISCGAWCLCFCGDTKDDSRRWYLKNGWVLDESILNSTVDMGAGDCSYKQKPRSGHASFTSILHLWCDAWSCVNCVETLYVRGPKGVPYE